MPKTNPTKPGAKPGAMPGAKPKAPTADPSKSKPWKPGKGGNKPVE